MGAPAACQIAREQFADPRWRLNNLYYITDKKGGRVLFKMKSGQQRLFDEMWYMNLILKHRQYGFTTFIQLFMLDACLFNSNVRAGTVAHTLIDAQAIFRDKVKFPYDNLPDGLKSAIPQITNSSVELILANNSSLRVGTSLRSGTMNYLHISEYGKLCAKYPEKAREVRTGALNTVQAGQIAFIESTGEGQEGHYYELCEEARAKARAKEKLTLLDFKFFFFTWLNDPDCEMSADGVTIPDEYARYFDKLKKDGIVARPEQKAWYVKKAEVQKGDMLREFPSTPDEAFEASIEGAYYANEMASADLQGRIGLFPAVAGVPVNTAWDIGYHNYTAIWFFQRIGGRVRLVGYVYAANEGMPYYLKEMVRLRDVNGWTYGSHFWPHDGKVHEWGSGKSRIEQAHDNEWLKIYPIIVPQMGIDDGIEACRAVLPICEFDQGPCSDGLKALRGYRKEWDETRGVWHDRPYANWAAHGADGFRTMAGRWHEVDPAPMPKEPVTSGYGRARDRVEPDSILTL